MGLLFDAVSKSYGANLVLEPVTLDVPDGQFLTILGPSGSGKTTMLRIAAGFTQPTTGRLRFNGQDITEVPTNRRPFNTVFQDYALFPHMSVEANVGYGLMVRGESREDIRRKVNDTLGIVGLGALLDRLPSQLSGGQRQRVALARALVCEPRLVLLDEPLAALDAELRRQMQLFLKDLQRRIATTFLFVTHDQEEAITMSDRIVVMSKGRVEQAGTPGDIYYAPATAFVARFFGDNNLISGTVRNGVAETSLGRLPVSPPHALEGPALLAIRPERISLAGKDNAVAVAAKVEDAIFVGAMTHLKLRPDAAGSPALLVKIPSDPQRAPIVPGQSITAFITPQDVVAVPPEAQP